MRYSEAMLARAREVNAFAFPPWHKAYQGWLHPREQQQNTKQCSGSHAATANGQVLPVRLLPIPNANEGINLMDNAPKEMPRPEQRASKAVNTHTSDTNVVGGDARRQT